MSDNRIVPSTSQIMEVWEPEPRKCRRSSIIREFALNTSTHGLPGIARSQSKHNCIFWTISFVAFLGIMIFFVVQAITNFFSYPTQTSVSISIEKSQVFPAVTICNYAPARTDKLVVPLLNYTNSINVTNTNDTSQITYQQVLVLRDFLRVALNSGVSMNDYFFSLEIMLISCMYNSVACSASDFISFLSSAHGQCYTFNAKTKGENGSTPRHTNDYGGSGKLVLRLYVHSHLYIPYVSEDVSAAMVTMIHDNTELPLIDVAGMELEPGRKHKLGYKRKVSTFLPSPYTDCTGDIPRVMQRTFDKYEGADFAYSQGVCYTLCAQAYTYDKCGCVSPYEWTARSVLLPDTQKIIDAPLCNTSNTCYLNASMVFMQTTTLWEERCPDCREECSTVSFSITHSSSAAPSLPYASVAKTFVENASVPLPVNWKTNWLSEVQNNYVSLEVVCESSQVENYTQEPSLSPTDLLSNVGGLTGLWIGISFLSIMELIEMLYRLFRHELHNVRVSMSDRLRRTIR